MTAVFELGGSGVQPETAHNLLRLIAEGSGEDEGADAELRLHAVSAYYALLQKPHLPDILMKARRAHAWPPACDAPSCRHGAPPPAHPASAPPRLASPLPPPVACQVVAWTLGEYGYLSDEFSLEALAETLCDVCERQLGEADTRCWLLCALAKLSAQMGRAPEQAREIARRYAASKSVNLQQ